ncbi:hypothetical protein WICPIJ_004611 [Wickerhamomyces pijperi]|uniref:DUF3074 domain-containing protein n=1 Tax=Wickerhamomyces pijperi TaxID=599730 RepID=A0A9P8TMR6_WICPI|nr:hypothetical protein WICPIJ_004611 [Wickerhamomyces pijperi]
MPFQFDTKENTLLSIPKDTLQFVKEANDLIESVTTKQWSKNKTYSYTLQNGQKEQVTTYYQTNKQTKEYWLSRVSTHSLDRYKFEDFAKFIGGVEPKTGKVESIYKHTEYETEYIHVLSKWGAIPLDSYPEYQQLESTEHLQKWGSIYAEYELGAPLTTRQFNEFILVVEPGYFSEDTLFVIQLVSNKPLENSHVKGVYCSIERVRLDKAGNCVEWIMATSSDSGGSVPKWLQNSMISKSVAGDVPSFLNWLNKK